MKRINNLLLALLFSAPAFAQPSNDECANAMILPFTCDTTLVGQTTIAATFDNVGTCGTTNTAAGVWYEVPGHDGVITTSTCNQASYDTKISVFVGSCGSLTCVGGQDDAAGCSGFTTEFSFFSNGALSYYIFVHGFGSATGNFDLTISRSTQGTPEDVTVCAGDSLLVNGVYQSASGTYSELLTSVLGCDSTATYNLTVLPAQASVLDDTLCAYETVQINGTTYDVNNPVGTEVLTSSFGCDSTVTVELEFYPALSSTYDTTVCTYDTLYVNGTAYHSGNPSGTESFASIGPNGCDSLVSVNLNFTSIDTTIVAAPPMLMSNQPGAVYQWIDCSDMSPIAGANDPDFTALVTGNYALELELDGCLSTTDCYLIDFTQTESQEMIDIEVYPNPTTHGQVTISTEEFIESVQVLDLLGRTCPTNFDGVDTLDLNSLTPGKYILQIQTSKGETSQMLVIM